MTLSILVGDQTPRILNPNPIILKKNPNPREGKYH